MAAPPISPRSISTMASMTTPFWNFGTLSYGVSRDPNHSGFSTGEPNRQPESLSPEFRRRFRFFRILVPQSRSLNNCQLVIGYTGAAAGTFQENLKVTYNNGSYAAEDGFVISVVTSPLVIPATLSISDGATNSYGQVLTQQSYDKTFQVTISGTLPATNVTPGSFLSSDFSYKGGSYPGVGGTCGTTITANCSIVVTLTPSAVQSYTDAIALQYNNGSANTQVSRTITANSNNPALLTLTAGTPSGFGSTPLNTAVTNTFTLSNSPSSIAATSISLAPLSGALHLCGGLQQQHPGSRSVLHLLRHFRSHSKRNSGIASAVFLFRRCDDEYQPRDESERRRKPSRLSRCSGRIL